MKTLVEQFMEEQGKEMPPQFKKMDWEKWPAWRRGEIRSQEFEDDSKWRMK